MNRSLWIEPLKQKWCPAWPCPTCRKSTLLLTPNSLISKETAQSKRAHRKEGWGPEETTYVFTAWAECRNPSCKQQFAIAGSGGVDVEFDANGNFGLEDYFSPMMCKPMPDMFDFPAKCPDDVKEELRAAFALFWLNQPACAGRIRVAIECLMNFLGVPKRKKDKNGKYIDLNLHARIDAIVKKEPKIGSHMMALKWLGNAGSHIGDVSRDDLLSAFEIMEYVLGEIIERRSDKVAKLAKALTKKHGK